MPDTTFASLLRSARTEARLTQKAASELLNIPKRTIEDWEGDRRHPNNFTADAVLQALKSAGKDKKMTKKISDMSGSELRRYLGIESVSDRSRESFDRWDSKHRHSDYREADDRRKDLIQKLTDFAFVGPDEDKDDPEDIAIFSAIKTNEDRIVIAKELVNCNTYSSIDVDVTFPEDYDGLDEYVYAAQVEFFHNLSGEYADREEILACFQGSYDPF